MKHWSLYISHTLMALLIIALASCSDTDYLGAPSEGDATEVYVSVMLNVNGGATDTRTRATITPDGVGNDNTPDISMEEGLEYENYINPYNVDLYIFDNDLKFVAKSINIISTTDRCIGVFDKIATDHITASQTKPYHIVAVCNHSQEAELTAGTSTLDNLIEALAYTYSNDFSASLVEKKYNDATIPMWGILPFRFNTSTNNATTLTNPINVLRAMAKVRIAITANGYTLNRVTLNVANTGGYVAAQKHGEKPQAYVESTTDGYTTAWNTDDSVTPANATPILYPSIPTNVPTIENLLFSEVTEDDDKKYWVIYIPEYNNMETDANPATISLSINDADGNAVKDQSGNNYSLHFADYSVTKAPTAPEWDIIRNDIYDYTITRIESGKLEARVRVMPWEYETMEYELSQHAEVEIISAPSAEFNYTNGRYTNKTIYETDNYATFIIKVKEPKGVRWNAHLSNPYFFDFTVDTQDYGYGGDEVHTIKVKPTYPYNTTKELQTTDLFFTVETLRDREVQLTYEANDVDDNDYGIAAGTRLHITQVSASAEEVGDETTPFTVASGLYDYTKRDTDLGLSQPKGIVTIQISDGKSGNGFANGVVMTEFNENLYSMWQESVEKEDAIDTHVKYASLSVTTENNNKVNSTSIWSNSPSVLCNSSIIGNSGNTDIINKGIDFCSSGGWISTENQLYAFINCWETANKTLDGGYACYRTSQDGTNWGTVTNVTMSGGGIMNGVIEQDPHVMENGRIITAAHFQQDNQGLYVSPIYTDDLTQGWKKAAFTHTTAYSNGSPTSQSKEMEPSLFKRNNGSLVMIFRDNEQNENAQSSYKLMASVSYDYGETWTKSVLTNMPDSRSKQCAGNLPDGTAYIVNNPVNDRNRWPLVITLSKDGFTFDTAYLLRSGTMMEIGTAWNGTDNQYPDVQTAKRSDGSWRYRGYHYPKAMVHGDYLYVSYSTNKEDVEYTRIPLSSIQLNDPSAR